MPELGEEKPRFAGRKGWKMKIDEMKIDVMEDFAEFQRKIDWVSARLKSRDVRERLDPLLLCRLKDSVAGVGSEEIAKLGAMSASDTGKLAIKVEAGALLLDVIAALGALGFEFHDDPVD